MRHRLYGGVRGSLCKGALYSIIFHDVIGKASKADATIIGLKLPSETIKPQKTFYKRTFIKLCQTGKNNFQ